jgi:hypothetical protein
MIKNTMSTRCTAIQKSKRKKILADEYLVAMTEVREYRGGSALLVISLRLTWLMNSTEGKVYLGKNMVFGWVSRIHVAKLAVTLWPLLFSRATT